MNTPNKPDPTVKSDPAVSADRARHISSTAVNDSGRDQSRARAGAMVAAGEADAELGWREAELIATAMVTDPVILWLTAGIGPPAQRWQDIVEFYRPLIAHGIRHGGLRTEPDPITGRVVAVRLWLPPRADDRDYYTQIARACQQHGQQRRRLHELLDNGRPADAHHLAVIAVHPGAHGHRFGSALLRARLDELDAAGAPSYTEATSIDARRWFHHHGFQVQEEVQLPAGGPPVWRMYRTPGTPYHPHPRRPPRRLAWPPGAPDHVKAAGNAPPPPLAEVEQRPGRPPPAPGPERS